MDDLNKSNVVYKQFCNLPKQRNYYNQPHSDIEQNFLASCAQPELLDSLLNFMELRLICVFKCVATSRVALIWVGNTIWYVQKTEKMYSRQLQKRRRVQTRGGENFIFRPYAIKSHTYRI